MCTFFRTGNLGDEQRLVFECPGLQVIGDIYNGLFEDHTVSMAQLMWQNDSRAVAQLIRECMYAHGDPGPQSQASDQP